MITVGSLSDTVKDGIGVDNFIKRVLNEIIATSLIKETVVFCYEILENEAIKEVEEIIKNKVNASLYLKKMLVNFRNRELNFMFIDTVEFGENLVVNIDTEITKSNVIREKGGYCKVFENETAFYYSLLQLEKNEGSQILSYSHCEGEKHWLLHGLYLLKIVDIIEINIDKIEKEKEIAKLKKIVWDASKKDLVELIFLLSETACTVQTEASIVRAFESIFVDADNKPLDISTRYRINKHELLNDGQPSKYYSNKLVKKLKEITKELMDKTK